MACTLRIVCTIVSRYPALTRMDYISVRAPLEVNKSIAGTHSPLTLTSNSQVQRQRCGKRFRRSLYLTIGGCPTTYTAAVVPELAQQLPYRGLGSNSNVALRKQKTAETTRNGLHDYQPTTVVAK